MAECNTGDHRMLEGAGIKLCDQIGLIVEHLIFEHAIMAGEPDRQCTQGQRSSISSSLSGERGKYAASKRAHSVKTRCLGVSAVIAILQLITQCHVRIQLVFDETT